MRKIDDTLAKIFTIEKNDTPLTCLIRVNDFKTAKFFLKKMVSKYLRNSHL